MGTHRGDSKSDRKSLFNRVVRAHKQAMHFSKETHDACSGFFTFCPALQRPRMSKAVSPLTITTL